MTEKTAKRLVRLHAALSKTLESSKASSVGESYTEREAGPRKIQHGKRKAWAT